MTMRRVSGFDIIWRTMGLAIMLRICGPMCAIWGLEAIICMLSYILYYSRAPTCSTISGRDIISDICCINSGESNKPAIWISILLQRITEYPSS